MIDLRASLRKIARDLVTLEVRTIVQPSITVWRMPDPPHALLDIAQIYATKLIELGCDVAFFFQQPNAELPTARPPPGTSPSAFDFPVLTNGALTFNRLRWAAVAGLEQRGHGRSPSQRRNGAAEAMLQRIRRHCDQLQGLLHELESDPRWAALLNKTRADLVAVGPTLPELPLSADEMTMLHKIWELGVDEVAMQTVIHLDGDVTTWVQEAFADPKFDYVHRLHERNIRIALESWTVFVQMVEALFSRLRTVVGRNWR
jgi:hypothetical protein